MFDFTHMLYLLIMAILISFLFSFWLIIIWVGLVHCYIYMTEWRRDRRLQRGTGPGQSDLFDKIEEYRNEFK